MFGQKEEIEELKTRVKRIEKKLGIFTAGRFIAESTGGEAFSADEFLKRLREIYDFLKVERTTSPSLTKLTRKP